MFRSAMSLAVLLPSLALAQTQSTQRMRGDFPPPLPHRSGSLQTAQAENLLTQSDAVPSLEKQDAPPSPDMMNTWEHSEQEWK